MQQRSEGGRPYLGMGEWVLDERKEREREREREEHTSISMASRVDMRLMESFDRCQWVVDLYRRQIPALLEQVKVGQTAVGENL